MREQAIVHDVEKIISDQQHINNAYAKVREGLNELVQIRKLDCELSRLLKDLYKFEDTLWQYATEG
jgi:vacuolar-type H+-ATPase subunit D/Vma8